MSRTDTTFKPATPSPPAKSSSTRKERIVTNKYRLEKEKSSLLKAKLDWTILCFVLAIIAFFCGVAFHQLMLLELRSSFETIIISSNKWKNSEPNFSSMNTIYTGKFL